MKVHDKSHPPTHESCKHIDVLLESQLAGPGPPFKFKHGFWQRATVQTTLSDPLTVAHCQSFVGVSRKGIVLL